MAHSHSQYSTTLTPFTTNVCGLPVTTFTATCSSAVLYFISMVLILAIDCPLSERNVTYFFIFLLVAMMALATMAGINMMYAKYRFNCLSLTISLFYSGSAALILLGLISSAIEGLCRPEGTPAGSLFAAKHVGNYFIWFITACGLAFQIVAHYYYG